MKFKVNLNPEIFDFQNLYNERQIIEKRLFELIKNSNFIKELPEWTIEINVQLGKGNWAGIYKKGITTSSMYIRSHTISLPIPSNKETEWGINEKKYVKQPFRDSSKFNVSDLNFSKYNNISDYITEESFLLIIDLLKLGIKLKNIDIKI
jgi:hypothetical protein